MCWPLKGHLRFLQVIQVTTITATVDWKSKEILPSIKHCMCWEFFLFPQWETTPVHFTVEISPVLYVYASMKLSGGLWGSWSVLVSPVLFQQSCLPMFFLYFTSCFPTLFALWFSLVLPGPLVWKATISLCLCLFSCFILCVLSGFVSAVCIFESLSLFQFYFLSSLSLPFWFLFIFSPLWTSLVEFLGF